jgi:hypothetical protein
MKKTNLPKKKLELSRATIKSLTDARSLAQMIGGLRPRDCASSESTGKCSGDVGCN